MSHKKPAVGHYYIVRHNGESWRGYQVRMPGTRSKLFSKARYSSWRSCFRAAKAYRDRLGKLMGVPTAPRGYRRAHSRSKTGVVGVLRVIVRKTYRYGRRVYRYRQAYWMANWSDRPKHVMRRMFSEKRYGRTKARELAIRARRAGISARIR